MLMKKLIIGLSFDLRWRKVLLNLRIVVKKLRQIKKKYVINFLVDRVLTINVLVQLRFHRLLKR